MNEQLYFPDFQPLAAAAVRPARLRLVVGSMSADAFTAALTLALACENVAFTTYSIMALVRVRGKLSICDISETLNLSYHAIVHQAERTPYFAFDRGGVRVLLRLNKDGERKAERIAKRLTQRRP